MGIKSLLSNTFFPNLCPVCNCLVKIENSLCSNCLLELEFFSENNVFEENNWDQSFHLFEFSGSARELIHKFKYNKKQFIIKTFLSYIQERALDFLADCDIDSISFVPMNNFKKLFRSYDHAFILANEISLLINKPLLKIFKKKITFRGQAFKSKKQRLKNLPKFLKLREKVRKNPEQIIGKNILLVDDVMTTGATLNCSTKILKEQGVNKVIIFTLAH